MVSNQVKMVTVAPLLDKTRLRQQLSNQHENEALEEARITDSEHLTSPLSSSLCAYSPKLDGPILQNTSYRLPHLQ
ncbi:hypothetical protein TNCT_516041 [Trichonephila clavata]|uniref:Uncharacterized protein n=1 Tax=Trichonephila clavata TaxID=2740835 RepID=A0A8X6GZN9_TRICU|nr:hypothetical protein TNCT_516041 [Trichonephila clavata]